MYLKHLCISISLFSLCSVMTTACSNGDVEYNDKVESDLVSQIDFNSATLAPATQTGVTELSEANLKGVWTSSRDELEFRNDGQAVFRDVQGASMGDDQKYYWELHGNVLFEAHFFDMVMMDGQRCESELASYSTAAIIGDHLYDNEVFIRTAGSGDSYDGTWIRVSGEKGWEDCDGTVDTYQEEEVTILTVNGAAITIDFNGDVSSAELTTGDEVVEFVPETGDSIKAIRLSATSFLSIRSDNVEWAINAARYTRSE